MKLYVPRHMLTRGVACVTVWRKTRAVQWDFFSPLSDFSLKLTNVNFHNKQKCFLFCFSFGKEMTDYSKPTTWRETSIQHSRFL